VRGCLAPFRHFDFGSSGLFCIPCFGFCHRGWWHRPFPAAPFLRLPPVLSSESLEGKLRGRSIDPMAEVCLEELRGRKDRQRRSRKMPCVASDETIGTRMNRAEELNRVGQHVQHDVGVEEHVHSFSPYCSVRASSSTSRSDRSAGREMIPVALRAKGPMRSPV